MEKKLSATSLTALDVVRGFPGLRALVVGDVMLDTYLEGTPTRLCKEGPVPVVRRQATGRAPGGAANAAANLAALGAEVMLIGLVGRDDTAATLRASLAGLGVDPAWLVDDEGVETLHKLRVLASDQYVVRVDEGDAGNCTAAGRSRLLGRIEEAFARCDLVVVPDYCYGVVTDEVVALLGWLRSGRPRVMAVDSKDVRRFTRARATVVTPNFQEACLALDPSGKTGGVKPRDRTEAEGVARRLLAVVDADHVAVTMAGDGVLLASRDGCLAHLPVHPVAHAGDVGAGDSFTAALALALASGADATQAARIGIDAAEIAITKRRTSVVRHQELLRRASLDDQTGALSLKEVVARVEAERHLGKTIVFTNGVFDILHAGHVQLLRRAKTLGDVLVVGVNSDASTRRLKGPTRPINTERDRAALIQALECVDYAVVFEDDTPEAVLRAVRPHVHVKGGDYSPERLPEAQVAREVGARIEILPFVEGRSTTNVIDKIAGLVNGGMLGAAR